MNGLLFYMFVLNLNVIMLYALNSVCGVNVYVICLGPNWLGSI